MCSAVRRRMLSNGTISSPTAARDLRRGAARRGSRCGRGPRAGAARAGPAGPRRVEHVVAGDAAALAGAADRGRVEALLLDQPAHDRRRHRAAAVGRRRGAGAGAGAGAGGAGAGGAARRPERARRGAAARARRRGRGRRRGRAARARARARRRACVGDHREARADRHGLALRHDDLGDVARPAARAPRSRPCRSTPRTTARRRRSSRRPA